MTTLSELDNGTEILCSSGYIGTKSTTQTRHSVDGLDTMSLSSSYKVIDFNTDGTIGAFADYNSLDIYDATDNSLIVSLSTSTVEQLKFSKCNNILCIRHTTGIITMYDVDTQSYLTVPTMQTTLSSIHCFGNYLVAVHNGNDTADDGIDSSVRLYDLTLPAYDEVLPRPIIIPNKAFTATGDDSGETLVVTELLSTTKNIITYNTSDFSVRSTVTTSGAAVNTMRQATSPDGTMHMSADQTSVSVYDTATGALISTVGHTWNYSSPELVWLSDSVVVLGVRANSKQKLFILEDGQLTLLFLQPYLSNCQYRIAFKENYVISGQLNEVLLEDQFKVIAVDLASGLIVGETVVASGETTFEIGMVRNRPCMVVVRSATSEVWKASTAYSTGDTVYATNPNANAYHYKCTTSGISSGTEPSWINSESGNTTDGTVVWTRQDELIQPDAHAPIIPQLV